MPTIKIYKTKPKAGSGWRPWGTAKTAAQAKEMAKYGYAPRDVKIVKFKEGETGLKGRDYVIYLKN